MADHYLQAESNTLPAPLPPIQEKSTSSVKIPQQSLELYEESDSLNLWKTLLDGKWSEKKEILSETAQGLPSAVGRYFAELFPIVRWLPKYNLTWALGDVIAGVTIALMVVPQSLAYSKLAGLPPEYGLYSSFMGVLVYCIFATTKDVTIGPTAVMALSVGQVLNRVNPGGSVAMNIAIATCFAFVAGLIMLGIGLLRLGWILEFVSSSIVTGFTTGGAITVIITQIPTLLGLKGVDSRADTWNVVYNTFRALPTANWVDCLFGLLSAAFLLAFKYTSRRYSKKSLFFWYLGVARTAIVVLGATLISYLINRGPVYSGSSPYNNILKNVPSGFTYVAVPPITNPEVMSAVWSGIPVVIILALLEHISIAKSFGRINGYVVVPSQECVAIGVTNVAASFFGGFPATGSFSRSAVKSQSGVRTPLAGIFTGILVLGAIFFLGPLFFWIPNATLAAVIMHGVAELISPPSYFKRLWSISKLDSLVAWVTILVACIWTIEIAIEVAIPLALILLLLRLAFPSYSFLVKSKPLDQELGNGRWTSTRSKGIQSGDLAVSGEPGIIVVRLEENLLYPNANRIRDKISEAVRVLVTPPQAKQSFKEKGQTNWNEYTVSNDMYWKNPTFVENVAPVQVGWTGEELEKEFQDSGAKSTATATTLNEFPSNNVYNPTTFVPVSQGVKLRAVIIDLANVNTIDSTGSQMLYDLGVDLQRLNKVYGNYVQMHFVNAKRNIKKVLIATGVVEHQKTGLVGTIVSSEASSVTQDIEKGEDKAIEDIVREATEVLPGLEGNSGAAAETNRWKTVVGLRKLLKSNTETIKIPSGVNTNGWDFFHGSVEEAVEEIKEIDKITGQV